MPVYVYDCVGCGKSFSLAVSVADRDAAAGCGDCGAPLLRRFSPTANVLIPAHMSASFKGSPTHEKWFASDECQKKLKTGEYEIAKGE